MKKSWGPMHRLLLYTQTFFTNNKLSSIDFVYDFCGHRQKFEFVCTNVDHCVTANQFLRLLVEGFSKPQQISVPFYLTFIVKPTIYIHIWIYIYTYIRIYIYTDMRSTSMNLGTCTWNNFNNSFTSSILCCLTDSFYRSNCGLFIPYIVWQ